MEEPNSEQEHQETTSTPIPELVLSLNFVPDWARTPPPKNRYEGHEVRVDQRDSRRSDRNRGPGGGRSFDRDDRRRSPNSRDGGDRGDRRPPRSMDMPRREYVEPAAVQVGVLPGRKALTTLVRQVKLAKKSFSVMDLAYTLIGTPAACLIRIEAYPNRPETRFFQCKVCRSAALDRATMAAHICRRHMEDFYEKSETVGDPPAGQFNCVAQCGYSGELLGPPNHHSYAEKVKQMHAARFPSLPFEQYRSRIKIVHDAALIEKWKEESRKQTVYKLRNSTDAKPVKCAEAEAHLLNVIAPSMIEESRKAMVPGDVALNLDDRALALTVGETWQRETRFPLRLSLAMRAAFRHMSLYVFKAGSNVHFVTSIRPSPMNAEFAIAPIQEVISYLTQHPGCKREEMVTALRPGAAADSPAVAEVTSPLTWLIDRGHIIEFPNATLAVPMAGHGAAPARKPVSAPATSEAPATPAASAEPKQETLPAPTADTHQ